MEKGDEISRARKSNNAVPFVGTSKPDEHTCRRTECVYFQGGTCSYILEIGHKRGCSVKECNKYSTDKDAIEKEKERLNIPGSPADKPTGKKERPEKESYQYMRSESEGIAET